MFKLKKIIATVLLVLCLCGCSFNGDLGGASSPEDVVENVLDAYTDADTEEIIDMLPYEIAVPYLKLNEKNIGKMDKGIEMALEGVETDYEVRSKTEMSEEEIKRYEERLTAAAQRYASEAKVGNPAKLKIDITEAYMVKAVLKNGKNRSTVEFPVGKIGENWYLLYDNPNM